METQTATLAGGCFWGMEDLVRKIPGVLKTEVGYTGGATENPTYNTVKTGSTGHAESLQITFNPSLLTYRQLLDWFFKMHDPTTANRQGNDIGSQYRSAIFYANDEQKKIATDAISAAAEKWKKPVVTEVTPYKKFYSAEDYHQNYLQKNPGGYTCHWIRDL